MSSLTGFPDAFDSNNAASDGDKLSGLIGADMAIPHGKG
jgi:hypothetical protein